MVHRAVVDAGGAAAEASRGRPGVEFLASTDPLFRPVNLRVGPDGALYVLDMHRGVIEHPEWIPDRIENTLNLYQGDDRGRIYRVVPAGGLPAWAADFGGFDRARSDDLVEALGHANRWRRLTAQRLLVEEHAAAPPAALVQALRKRIVESGNVLGRLHALWTLAGVGAIDRESPGVLLRDSHPELRRNAVLAFEESLRGGGPTADTSELADAVVTMIGDRDPGVRLQAILTAGMLLGSDASPGPEFGRAVAAAIVAGVARHAGETPASSAAAPPERTDVERDGPWLRLAAVSVLADDPASGLRLLLESGGSADPGAADVIERVAALPGGTWLERMGALLDAGLPEAVQRAAMAELTVARKPRSPATWSIAGPTWDRPPDGLPAPT